MARAEVAVIYALVVALGDGVDELQEGVPDPARAVDIQPALECRIIESVRHQIE
jgi:hypothetical protein